MEPTLSAMPISSVLVRNRIGGSTTVFLPSSSITTSATTQSSTTSQALPLNLDQQHHQHLQHFQLFKEYNNNKQEIQYNDEKKEQTFYRNKVDNGAQVEEDYRDVISVNASRKIKEENVDVNEEQQKQHHLDGYQRRNSSINNINNNINYSFLCVEDDFEKNKVEQNLKKKKNLVSSSLLPSSASLLLCSTRSSSLPSSVQSAINISTAHTSSTSVNPQLTKSVNSYENSQFNSHVVTIQVKTDKEVVRKEVHVNNNSNITSNNFDSNNSEVFKVNQNSAGYNNFNNTSVISNNINKPSQSSKISIVSTVGLSPSECLITKASNKSLIKIEQNDRFNNLINCKTNDEMVQKSDIDVNNQQYYYYMVPSGQCSPSDTLDSGTCSDLEVSPPPVPKKMSLTSKYLHNSHHLNNNHHNNNNSNTTNIATETEKQNNAKNSTSASAAATTTALNRSGINSNNSNGTKTTKSNGHLSDSDESQISLSCDSLNGSDINVENHNGSIMTGLLITKVSNDKIIATPPPPPPPLQPLLITSDKDFNQKSTIVSYLPDSLLKDIRERSTKLNQIQQQQPKSQHQQSPSPSTTELSSIQSSPSSLSPVTLSPISTPIPQNKFEIRSYKSRMARDKYVTSSSPSSVFENDKFYKFHINEHNSGRDDGHMKSGKVDIDEAFAGYKDISNGTSTIRSNKGTIRGVKNRVRNGIATFLQMQNTNIKVSNFIFTQFSIN